MEKLLTVSKNKTGSWLWLRYELLIAKFRLKLNKVGETTSPFSYGLNQIPYDYTVEVRSRFKGLDLIEFLMNYRRRFMTLYRRQGARPSPGKKKMQKRKMAVWGNLTNSCEKKKKEKWTEKEKRKDVPTHFNAELQRIVRRDKKAFLSDQCKEIEENNRVGKTRDLFKKIRDTKGIFHAKMGLIKDRNCMDLTETENIRRGARIHRKTV